MIGIDRSENMRRIKSRNTKPEIAVRKLVHSMGYRYRLHRADLPGNPDLVFSSRRKVIFVHGCFWHAHGCKVSHTPMSNTRYWSGKLDRNQMRDKIVRRALAADDWKLLVVWECQIARVSGLKRRIQRFLDSS